MRVVWGGFALGVIALQQQAALPSLLSRVGVLLLALAACAWALFALGDSGSLLFRRVGLRAADGRWRRASGWAAVGIAAAGVGFDYAALRADLRLSRTLPAAWESRELSVSGYVASLPEYGEDGARFRFAVEAWPATDAADGARSMQLPSTIRLTWSNRDAPVPVLEPGSRWQLPVRLKQPHASGNFGLRDGEVALLARGVRATGYVSSPQRALRNPQDARGLGVAIERLRWRVHARIDAVLAGAPHRGIVVALATGAQDAVSEADWRLMRRSGTSHLVAISGLHLAFVAALAGGLASAVWRRIGWRGRSAPLAMPAPTVALLCALPAAAAYAALAGFNVPVQRALWMLVAGASAVVCGRNVARSQSFAWALGAVLIVDPWAVVSAGFWLSFCAVAAILFALAAQSRDRRIDDSVSIDGDPRHAKSRIGATLARVMLAVVIKIRSSARVQFAVTLALAPLTLYRFAQMPLIGPLANAFAIPWVSVLVTPIVLAGVLLPAPLDAAALRVAHRLFELLATSLDAISRSSWAVLHVAQPGAWALFCAALGVAWCLAPRGWPLRWAAPFTWLPLLLPAPSGPPHGAFRITALDVGQGTSVLVETARHTLLFDAGTGPEATRAGERIVVPYLQARGVSRIDTLMISHDDSDHAGGAAAVLDEIGVKTFVGALAPAHPLWSAARSAGVNTLTCAAGQHWQWDGVDFDVLWPDAGALSGRTNEHCCVLRMSVPAGSPSHEHTAALLAADIEAATERTLLARDPLALRASLFVVPHHGSRTSSTEPFLDAVRPLVAVFQVGYLNRFRHPHPGVYARYVARGIVLARSDRDGAVRVDVRDGALDVERYRDTQRRYWMTPADEPRQAARQPLTKDHDRRPRRVEEHPPLFACERLSGLDVPDALRRTRRPLRRARDRAHRSRSALSGHAGLAAPRRSAARRHRATLRRAGLADGPFARRLSVVARRAAASAVGERGRDARLAGDRGLAQQPVARVAVDGPRRAPVAGGRHTQAPHHVAGPRSGMATFPSEAGIRTLGRTRAVRLCGLRHSSDRGGRHALARVRSADRISDLPDAAAHARCATRARRAGAGGVRRRRSVARGASGRARCDASYLRQSLRMDRRQSSVSDGAADRNGARRAAAIVRDGERRIATAARRRARRRPVDTNGRYEHQARKKGGVRRAGGGRGRPQIAGSAPCFTV
jgi:competence protein ComEC